MYQSEERAAASASEVCVGALRRDAATGGACDETLLQQIRLVNFADSIGFLAHRRRETLDPDWAAVELVDNCGEDRAVHAIESAGVDFERAQGHLASNDRSAVDLRKIAHPPQQAIRDARGAARTSCHLMRAVVV